MAGEHAVLEGTEQQDGTVRAERGVPHAVEVFDHGTAVDVQGKLPIAADFGCGAIPGGREHDGPRHIEGPVPHLAVHGDLEAAVVLAAEGGGVLAVRGQDEIRDGREAAAPRGGVAGYGEGAVGGRGDGPDVLAVDGGGLRRPALCEHGLPEEGAVAGEPPLAFLADGRDDVAGLGLKNGFPRAGVGFAPALAVDGNGIFVRRDAHGAGDAVAFPVKTGRPRVQVALFPCLAVDGNRIDALAEAFQIGLSEPGGLDDCGGFAGFRKDEIGGGGVEPFPRRAVDQHAVFHTGLHGHGDGPGVVEPGSPQIVGVFFAFRVVDHNGPLAVALGQGRQPPVGGELAVIHLVGARFPQRIVQAYGKSAVFEGRNRRERFAVRRNLPFLLPCRFGQHRRFPDLSDRRFPIIPFLIFHTVPHWV